MATRPIEYTPDTSPEGRARTKRILVHAIGACMHAQRGAILAVNFARSGKPDAADEFNFYMDQARQANYDGTVQFAQVGQLDPELQPLIDGLANAFTSLVLMAEAFGEAGVNGQVVEGDGEFPEGLSKQVNDQAEDYRTRAIGKFCVYSGLGLTDLEHT